jgi:hypothetical protein
MNQDTRNSLVVLESYTMKMDVQAKIEAKLMSAFSSIHSVTDLTETKRTLVVLKAKIEAERTDI